MQKDCKELLQCLSKYGFKKRNVFNLSKDPTRRDVEYSLIAISSMLRAGKKKKPLDKFLVIFLFAGHGLMVEGQQNLLYNEFDNREKFYRLLRAEAKLRTFAEIYPNSYIISIFACCR